MMNQASMMRHSRKIVGQEILRTLLYRLNIAPTKLASRRQISDLIALLHPYDTGHNLLRIGPPGDGGYLVPDDLHGISAVFSPGVANEAGFELHFASLHVPVFMSDGSIGNPPYDHPNFFFQRKHIGAVNRDGVSTLRSWVDERVGRRDTDLLLQMDIEGSEFEVLTSAGPDLLERFRIVVIEFHDLHLAASMPVNRLMYPALAALNQTHICVHLHPNNQCGAVEIGAVTIPRALEATFIRRDRIRTLAARRALRHPLDRPNTAGHDLTLGPEWYAIDFVTEDPA